MYWYQHSNSSPKYFHDDCSDTFIIETNAVLESIYDEMPHNVTHLSLSSSSNAPKNHVTDNIINTDACNHIIQ